MSGPGLARYSFSSRWGLEGSPLQFGKPCYCRVSTGWQVIGDESQSRRLRTADAFTVCGFERAKWSVGQRSLDDVDLAKAKGLYKRTIYPPPAIQHRTDICAINAIMIRKSDLASLVINCGSQQMNDVIFLKDKSVAAQIVGRSNRTSFPIGRPLYAFAVGIAL